MIAFLLPGGFLQLLTLDACLKQKSIIFRLSYAGVEFAVLKDNFFSCLLHVSYFQIPTKFSASSSEIASTPLLLGSVMPCCEPICQPHSRFASVLLWKPAPTASKSSEKKTGINVKQVLLTNFHSTSDNVYLKYTS